MNSCLMIFFVSIPLFYYIIASIVANTSNIERIDGHLTSFVTGQKSGIFTSSAFPTSNIQTEPFEPISITQVKAIAHCSILENTNEN